MSVHGLSGRLFVGSTALLLFLLLAGLVSGGYLDASDKSVLLTVRDIRTASSAGATDMFRALTRLGDFSSRIVLTSIAAALLWWRGHPREAIILVIAVIGGAALVEYALKPLFGRVRPDIVEHVLPATGLSFPSGHAAGGTVTYLTMAWLIAALTRTKIASAGIFAAGVLAAFGIGASRIWLGVHWPSDVLGGWLLGIAIAAFALSLVKLAAGAAEPATSEAVNKERRGDGQGHA